MDGPWPDGLLVAVDKAVEAMSTPRWSPTVDLPRWTVPEAVHAEIERQLAVQHAALDQLLLTAMAMTPGGRWGHLQVVDQDGWDRTVACTVEATGYRSA